jgi:hypothetical protein
MLGRYRMHWLLGLTALLVWLNTRPVDAVDLVKVTQRTSSVMQQPEHPADTVSHQAVVELPAELNRPALVASTRDPFVLTASPAPMVIKPVLSAPPAALPAAVQPSPPSPPPINLSFAGRMTAPDGSQILYISYGDAPLALAVGQILPNGYRVDAITAQAVELSYPPSNTTARLDLPAPPKYEIR